MLIVVAVLILVLGIILIGKIILSRQFKREVRILFAQSKNISSQIHSKIELDILPESVQRYFNLVLKEGQPYINYARLKHDGQFKPSLDKPWIDITGEQYFTTQKPGFIWKGTTNLFTARDMFIRNKGRLVVSLLSVYNIVDAHGEQYNQGELLRWLSESVWFPTNLLPNDRLNWEAKDANTATLHFAYHGIILYFVVTFNSIGEIIQMETKRFMNKERLEAWVIKASNYKKINGVIVPTTAEAVWRLANGDYSYAKFRVTDLEYDTPEIF